MDTLLHWYTPLHRASVQKVCLNEYTVARVYSGVHKYSEVGVECENSVLPMQDLQPNFMAIALWRTKYILTWALYYM